MVKNFLTIKLITVLLILSALSATFALDSVSSPSDDPALMAQLRAAWCLRFGCEQEDCNISSFSVDSYSSSEGLAVSYLCKSELQLDMNIYDLSGNLVYPKDNLSGHQLSPLCTKTKNISIIKDWIVPSPPKGSYYATVSFFGGCTVERFFSVDKKDPFVSIPDSNPISILLLLIGVVSILIIQNKKNNSKSI
ncbi:MAG: hypothetical protein WCW13_00540 [archaeon]|jgi:hypothetical protein